MKRRDFLLNSSAGAFGLGMLGSQNAATRKWIGLNGLRGGVAKNIIFLVSDGMSMGTLQMADLFHRMQTGNHTTWIQLYRGQNSDQKIQRSLMDTGSANSYVTDSAAASSAWGGGVRVKNGRLNVGSGNKLHKPIFQKFKEAGKKVGCVTTVPITHATPAGFCVNSKSRNAQPEIAEMYLQLKFDVMLGGGREYFKDGREDQRDLFQEFKLAGFQVAESKGELSKISGGEQPVLGVFHKSGLPFSIDLMSEPDLQAKVPTLAEMTQFAIDRMKDAPKGFVLQVEAGKVDWAAHANDTPALIYDQLAFDEALKVAIEFAEADKETLVIITTDHGNANPGLHGCSHSIDNFERLKGFKRSHGWILQGLKQGSKVSEIMERTEHALGFAIKQEEAQALSEPIVKLSDEDLNNDYKLPFTLLAKIAEAYTSVAWVGDDHTGDYVELAMFGPGSELLPPFVRNTELHNFMLTATDCVSELVKP